MKEIIKLGSRLFGRLTAVTVMAIFLVISMSVLTTAVFTTEIGYIAFGVKEGENENEKLYEYYYKDGDDTKLKEYEDKGYTVTTSAIQSKVSKTGMNTFLIVTQIINIIMLISFLYSKMWEKGTKDSNLVSFKHMKSDPLKGVKCGLVCIIPSVLFDSFILITKNGLSAKLPLSLLRFLNAPFYSVCEVLFNGSTYLGEIAIWRIVLSFELCFIIPIITGVSYYLGFKNISLSEKFVYKR